MTVLSAILTRKGLMPTDYEADSLRQAARLEPRGVYTVARTYDGDKAVLLDSHLDRLEESARLEGMELRLRRDELRTGLRQVLQQAGNPESRFRITVPLGEPGMAYLALEPLQPLPERLRQAGVTTATYSYQRENPRSKSNSWEPLRAEALDSLPEGVLEGLLVDIDGSITEGFTSNFYAVLEGALRTAEDGILRGISRRILLEVVPGDLPLELSPVNLLELPRLEEAFLTSSSRGVVPIVRIDEAQIHDGLPGARTRQLIREYDRWVETHVEPI